MMKPLEATGLDLMISRLSVYEDLEQNNPEAVC
jgi:hypothetical protein